MTDNHTNTAAITQWLLAWSDGRRDALDHLTPLVYDDLRRLAARYMQREPVDHTLQPTALVHEAYLRLIDQRQVQWRNRAHFFAMAAGMMRRILVDHARGRLAEKRGGGWGSAEDARGPANGAPRTANVQQSSGTRATGPRPVRLRSAGRAGRRRPRGSSGDRPWR